MPDKKRAANKTASKSEENKDLEKIKSDIFQDSHAKLFDDLEGLPHRIVGLERVYGSENLSKKINLKCSSCDFDFTKEAIVEPITLEILCPECNQIHVMKFIPPQGLFAVKSDSAQILEDH
jgi:hypothetical protein